MGLTVIDMEEPAPGQTDESQRTPAAPEYVIDMLLGVMRPYPGPPGAAGSVAYARAARAEARVYADRIWAEAWHTGAAWGLARNTRIHVEVTAERLAELAQGNV